MSIATNKHDSEFIELYRVLNAPQKQAVDAIEGPVMVIAGPGTGKTTILTLRIANILRKTDTAPENILALTFTESGAFAMRRKLLSIIGPAAYKVNIHTFHGFAEKVIQSYPDYFPRIIGSSIITDAEQFKIIRKLIALPQVSILRPYGDPTYYVRSVLNEIHLLKRENVSPEELKKSIVKPLAAEEDTDSKTELEKRKKRDEKNSELTFIYKKYEEELALQKYYDFDDMLLELIRAMESDKTFKLILQESYQYILADEHQDANASQNRILELLADFHDSPNLFIVGDDKQAIYRFQGASLENFLYFTKKYKDARVIDLKHNYRSHQGILDASHSVIANNPGIPGHKMTKLASLQMGMKPIYVDEFATDADEAEYLAVIIERLIGKGEKPEEIAVLYRENRQAPDISLALRAYGIPHRIESDHNILEDIDPAKLIVLCRAIHDPSDSELLAKALLITEMKADSSELALAFNRANREKKPLFAIIREDRNRSLKEAYEKIVKWSKEAAILAFPDFLQKLIEETSFLASIVSANDSLERLASLEVFFERMIKASESKKDFHIKEFIEYIDIVSEHGLLSKRSYSEHVGGVRLMTAHRAKGLEFNHVFIVRASDGVWGNRTKRNLFSVPIIEHARDAGRIEDERRLFYVAMTRARESITISYARSDGEKETMPSQFIAEIDQSLVSFEKPVVASHTDIFSQKMMTKRDLPKVSILNQEFIRSKYLSQPLSVTHLNNYLECPWKYFFVNLLRIPQAPTKHQMYGTAVHAALRAFFEAYKDERDLGKKKLVEIFAHYLDLEPLSVEDRVESLKKGKQALEGYYTAYYPTWGRRLATEYAIKGAEIELDNVKAKPGQDSSKIELVGKLDKIEYIDDHNSIVTDFKTAKPRSRNEIEGKTQASDGNYLRQLTFYKLISGLSQKFNMSYGEIDFIEPNQRGIYKKERFEIKDEEVERLKVSIKKMSKEILEGAFMRSGCKQKDCSYCRLADMIGG